MLLMLLCDQFDETKSRWDNKKACIWNAFILMLHWFKIRIFSFHLSQAVVVCQFTPFSVMWASCSQLTLLTGCRFDGTDLRTMCRFCFCRSGHILSIDFIIERDRTVVQDTIIFTCILPFSNIQLFISAFRVRSWTSCKSKQSYQIQWKERLISQASV